MDYIGGKRVLCRFPEWVPRGGDFVIHLGCPYCYIAVQALDANGLWPATSIPIANALAFAKP